MRMAFLSSFRIGQQTVYPEELHERLKSFALLENVGDAALRNLLAEANWFALPGGTLLDRDGENNAALFLVVTGSLGVFVLDAQGQTNALAGMGRRGAVLDASASDQTAEWFNTFEQSHDIVFYRGDAPDSPWTHQCLRQADRIFLLARANHPLPLAPLDLPAFK